MLFVPYMAIKISTSCSNSMHMPICRRVSVEATTTVFRADHTTDQNTALLEGVYPLMHTSLIFAYPLQHRAVHVTPPTYVVMSEFSLTIRK